MAKLQRAFADVADALGIGNSSIVEKDYYVVELLRLLQSLKFDTHQLVFAGGTSLAKAKITLNRMSEDVDIKLVPNAEFLDKANFSLSQRKVIKKQIIDSILATITGSEVFKIDEECKRKVRDEYRYNEMTIRYPQKFSQIPCLRPFIKLELIEVNLLEPAELRDISSLVFDITTVGNSVPDFLSATVVSTQAEKIIAMMRRTAELIRNRDRKDDESLVRHIYDNYRIIETYGFDDRLVDLAQRAVMQDIKQYGHRHSQLRDAPVCELQMALDEIGSNPIFQQRYQNFVIPMVFENSRVTWDETYQCFRHTASAILNKLLISHHSLSF